VAKKDFARNKAPRRREQKSGVSMLPFAILLIAGLCFAGGYWVATEQRAQDTVSQGALDARQTLLEAKVAENNILQAKVDILKKRVALWKSKAGQDAHSKVGDLHFYTDLPKQSVMPSPVVEPASLPTRSAAQSSATARAHPIRAHPAKQAHGWVKQLTVNTPAVVNGFRIQIASFRSMAGALGLQKKLNQAGFRAFVQTVDLSEKGQWFRTCGGPYASKAEAEQQLPAIEALAHVKGLLIRGG